MGIPVCGNNNQGQCPEKVFFARAGPREIFCNGKLALGLFFHDIAEGEVERFSGNGGDSSDGW